ncbi:hypothetical protein [Duganella sp.]|uniref:hypothetical protein n=1 Tax=Duganella sp. TaxID=1904440 RepID=UPI0031D645D8
MRVASPAVLVAGVAPMLTWSVARCLRRAGHAPVVLGRASWSPMRCTTDCRRYLPWRDGVAQLGALCESTHIDVVMAADAAAASLLADAPLPACAAPAAAATAASFDDRWHLVRLLQALDLPAPHSVRLTDSAQLLGHSLVYPIVTAPLTPGAGVVRHPSHQALERAVARGQLGGYPMIAQSCVTGWKVTASFLAWQGRLTACAVLRQTRRGRTFYPSRRVREYVERLVAACNYSGAGHLDLRYDPARDSYFILDFKPQFGNSVLHAARAGLNLPALLLQLGETAPRAVALPRAGRVRLPVREQAMGLATRWLSVG